jgi:hypothetical protein
MLSAIARPSRLLVPRPSSSIIARLCLSIFLSSKVSIFNQRHAKDEYLPQNESCFSHLGCKCRNISFDAVIHGNSGKKLMNNWERGVCCRDKTANLSHHSHESSRTNIGAFATHITTCDNLKARLLSCVNVVRDKLLLVNLGKINLETLFSIDGRPFLEPGGGQT